MEIFNVRPLSVITAITVQNGDEVSDFFSVPKDYLIKQLESLFSLNQPAACKIGMLTEDSVAALFEFFESRENLNIPIILDPILKSSSGFSFLAKEKFTRIFKHCALVTPNIPEMEVFVGFKIETYSDIENSLVSFSNKYYCPQVLLKGGHKLEFAGKDFLYSDGHVVEISETKHNITEDIHGTGCFLSTAIASCLANGMELEDSIRLAKKKLVEYAENSILPHQAKKRIFSFS